VKAFPVVREKTMSKFLPRHIGKDFSLTAGYIFLPNAQGVKMKIIGIIASPQKEGNTAWVINKILEGAKEQGAETRSWYFSDHDIKPCRGCLCCHKEGNLGCIIKDDMQELYGVIEHADALILGSPVYMGQMSAQAKTVTDRLFAQISPRFSPYYKEKVTKKKLILVFTQGNPDPGMFQVYFDYTKHIFQLLEFDVNEVVVVAGMRNEPAHERKDLDTVMKNIGSTLVPEQCPE
jgi:multimeric flavodoxin WrbA